MLDKFGDVRVRKAEQKVWDAMKRAQKRIAPKLWMQRVENLVGDGMPDVYVEGPWIELKAAKLPKRLTTRLQYSEGVRQSQVNWHLKAETRGVISYILVRVEEKKDEPLLLLGGFAKVADNFTWIGAKAAACAVGWQAIFDRIAIDIKEERQ
jgi:hypothetical protein